MATPSCLPQVLDVFRFIAALGPAPRKRPLPAWPPSCSRESPTFNVAAAAGLGVRETNGIPWRAGSPERTCKEKQRGGSAI